MNVSKSRALLVVILVIGLRVVGFGVADTPEFATTEGARPFGASEGLTALRQSQSQPDGPFGLAMGLSKAEVTALVGPDLKDVEGQQYLAATAKVPRSHPRFKAYMLQVLPTAGLCAITAVGVDVRTSSHGVEMLAEFDAMVESLQAAYGDHRRNDFLRSGSIWDEPEDWMMALSRKERVLQAVWDQDAGSSSKNRVKEVILSASTTRTDAGYLVLQYRFENQDQCEAELKRLMQSVL